MESNSQPETKSGDDSELKLLESVNENGASSYDATQPPESDSMTRKNESTDRSEEYEKLQKQTERYWEDMQLKKKEGFFTGCFLGASAVVCIIFVALAITTIIYGSLGLQGKDNCGYSNLAVSAFDVSSGVVVVLLVALMVLLMSFCLWETFAIHSGYSGMYKMMKVMIVVAIFGVIVLVIVVANYVFSFVAVVKEVYVVGAESNNTVTDCASPAFYTAFTYVTIEFIVFMAIPLTFGIIGCVCFGRSCYKSSKL